jgi:hypothetical protein
MFRDGALVLGVCIHICLMPIYVSALCFQFLFRIVFCVFTVSHIHSSVAVLLGRGISPSQGP